MKKHGVDYVLLDATHLGADFLKEHFPTIYARCLKLGGFVSCAPAFLEHPAVINGASDLVVEVMGEAGQHARFAVGCASLPRNAAVEVEGIFELA